MKELSIFNQLRPVTVGFDGVFDNFEQFIGFVRKNVAVILYSSNNSAV